MKPQQINKILAFEIKGVDDDAKTVHAVVSTKKVDRDGDIILPEAFKSRLKIYKEHPVFLANHRYDTNNQIGEATSVKVTDEGLECTFKYYVGMGNPTADWCWTLAKQGIAAFSIGFIGHEWEPIKDKETQYMIGRTFTDIELIEVSQVVVPSNRGALQLGRSANAVEAELMEAVEKGFKDGKLSEVIPAPAPEFCKCGVIKDEDIEAKKCSSCKKDFEAEALKVAQTEMQKRKAAAEEAVKQVSEDEEQLGHYFSQVMEKGAKKDAEPSPEVIGGHLTSALRKVLKS